MAGLGVGQLTKLIVRGGESETRSLFGEVLGRVPLPRFGQLSPKSFPYLGSLLRSSFFVGQSLGRRSFWHGVPLHQFEHLNEP